MSQLVTTEESAIVDERVTLDYRSIALAWLEQFGAAASSRNVADVVDLLSDDPWWRDLYALTWDLTGMHGVEDISKVLTEVFRSNSLSAVTIDDAVQASFQNDRYIEAIYRFNTTSATGRGVVRLINENGEWKAWMISTVLDSLKDFPPTRVTMANAGDEHFNVAATPGTKKTSAELKDERRSFRESDPSVLIVGAGHSGIQLAAYLQRIGVPTLLVDTYARVGDNWRLRYNGLALHDMKWAVQFPFIPYPEHWPVFIDKDRLADWLESYTELMELNLWTSTKVEGAVYDDVTKKWTVEIDRDGERRTLKPNHLVIATGLNGLPKQPKLEGMESFQGVIQHSSEYEGESVASGKRVVVVGAGSSAHDIAQDAYESAATSVTMVQRSPTYVYSQRRGVPIQFGTYYSHDHLPIQDADLLATVTPTALARKLGPIVTKQMAETDKELIEGLERAGFRTTLGPDDAGLTPIATVGGVSYYIDKGASKLIIDGHIRIQQGEVVRFTPTGVVYSDGTEEEADIVVLSTGFTNVRESVRPIVGDEVADQLATVWNIDERGEVRTAMRHSGHEKLWFVANGLRFSRIYGNPLAVMIKAIDEGLLDPAISVVKKSPEPV